MLRMRSTIFLVAIFMLSSIPVQAEDSGRAIICGESDISQLPSQINVLDQECHQISLGPLLPGATVEFDLSASGLNFDFLVFKANALPVYSNEQSYRSSTIWAEETVFEEIGLGRASYNWHWTVPDGTESNWYVVLDNMAHSGDGGQGSQGGSLLIVDLDITFPSSNIWTLHDELVRMGVNDHSLLVDSSSMILDEGTQVQIRGIPLAGNPDIFLLTASQRQSYLDGTAPEFSVIGSSNLLQITSDITETYTVDSAHAGIPLYLYADNEQGPTGGGDGQSEAIFTVIVTLNPVLDGVITTGNPGATIDVGESISFSANSTPNLSGQIDASGYQWDLDLDGNYDLTRNWAETSWSAPGTYTIRLLTQGIDSQSDTTDFVIDVEDMTAPSAQFFGGSSNFPYGYDAPITLTSSSTDNHVIEREEWWVDGMLEQSDNKT
ncbi:MAG: hypothetical protein QF440_00890, partial [Candidatus Thalassarchaeaceae archaeon]|nr:hypothetical protein [Candidatus Thalassarchaeaceae archaeon]